MKKYLVILGAALLVMALASPSLAQGQFQSWGFLQVEQGWTKNLTSFDSDRGDDNKRWIAERFRFFLQYGDPKTVRAVIGFETTARTGANYRLQQARTGPAWPPKTAPAIWEPIQSPLSSRMPTWIL